MAAASRALLLLLAAAAVLLLQQDSHAAAPGRPYARHSRRRSSTPSSGQQRALQRAALQAHVQSLLQRCPSPGYCFPRSNVNVTAAAYLRQPGSAALRQQQQVVAGFLQGEGFQKRLAALRKLRERRGILISAGKAHHVGNTAIMLHALRRHLNCSLPVEIAYRGDREVDRRTRKMLSAAFPPLYWLDLDAARHPRHHRRGTMDRYEPKIYALYFCRFQQVLLLDADNMPLADPAHLFESPHITAHGNMFWLDLWSPSLSSTTFVGHDSVYPLVGLAKQAYWEVLGGGQGYVTRAAESGQLLLDRVAHADMLEWLLWLTSHSAEPSVQLYKHVLGDKDTFGFAFAAARKLHQMAFVAVPPGAGFRHVAAGASADKAGSQHVVPTYRFQAMLQFDHDGSPAFLHRTFEKWNDVRVLPRALHVVTGPLSNRFIYSYLGNSTSGLTPDIPDHVLRPAAPNNCPAPAGRLAASSSSSSGGGSSYAPVPGLGLHPPSGCPVGVYLDYLRLRDWGLPITTQRGLVWLCRHVHTTMARTGLLGGDDASAGGDGRRQQLLAASSSSSRSSRTTAALWARLREPVWLHNCLALQQAAHAAAGAGSSSSSAVLAVNCSAAAWHVARYALGEYAEALATDAAGKPLADADPQQPALLLATAGGGDSHGGGCGGDAWSPLAVLQQRVLPDAVAWVNAHLQQLPMLQLEGP